jgi:hypothetical protein
MLGPYNPSLLNLDQLVHKEFKEHQVEQDLQAKVLQEPLVLQAAKERLALLEPSAIQAAQALQVSQDPQVLLDLQVVLASQGLLDPLGQQE